MMIWFKQIFMVQVVCDWCEYLQPQQKQQKQYEFIEFNSTIHRVDAKKCSVYEYLSWRLDAFADATVNNHPCK